MPSPGLLFASFLVSAIGAAYFIYGKRQAKYVALTCGIALCVYPYFVDSWLWLCVIGAALIAAPFIVDF